MQGENGSQSFGGGDRDVVRRVEPNGSHGAQAPFSGGTPFGSGAVVQPGATPGTLGASPGAEGGQGRLAAQKGFGILTVIPIQIADLDELVKREAFRQFQAKGSSMSEGRFFERAVVERCLDGSVRVTVSE